MKMIGWMVIVPNWLVAVAFVVVALGVVGLFIFLLRKRP